MSDLRRSYRPGLRQALSLFLVVAVGLVLTAGSGLAQEGDACTDVAHVTWAGDWSTAIVARAIVEVEGCDGEVVGIQLLTEDGDVPEDGPMMAQAAGGAATFDLTPLAQRIEPVVGVRVFLELVDEEVVFVAVTVDRRFFNPAGNEQRGLRQVAPLQVPLGDEYLVPGAPDGYLEVACTDVNTTVDDDVFEEGSGVFTATVSGRHIACYQQQPGVPPGSPGEEDPEVLSDVLTDTADAEVLGVVRERAAASGRSAQLARTGMDLWLLVAAGGTLLLAGGRLARLRR